MAEIMKGSLVSVVFSIVAFSHTDVDNMFSYNGVPCLLDIIAGTGMILKALDEAIMCMNVGDEREILIPAIDASQTARALGVRMRGFLKYELKVIRVVNTPVGATEVAQFFSKGTVTLASLSECKEVKKGPFNISRTYDMFEAVAISEEFRILEAICKENATHIPSRSIMHLSEDEHHTIHETSENNPNRSVKISSIPFLSNSASHYLIPSWPISVSRESFLPDLMQLAVSSCSRIIILFDSPGDWEEIGKSVAKQKIKQNIDESYLSYNSGIKLRIDGVLETVQAEVENSPLKITEITSNVIQDPNLGSDISMAVESEETDITKNSVLTWLRIAIDPSASSSSCRKCSCDESQSDVKRSKNNTENAENSAAYNSSEKSPSSSTAAISFQAGVSDITGDNNKNIESNRGYRVALIRFSGWDRGSAPQGRLWDGFWKLYTSVKNELQSASSDTPLSVLIADIGAVPAPKPDKVQVPESDVQVPESEVQVPESEVQDPKSKIASPQQPEGAEKILMEVPCATDSTVESTVMSFGGGDRTGLFLLIERIKECMGEGRGGSVGEGGSGGGGGGGGGGKEVQIARGKVVAVAGHISAASDSSSGSGSTSSETSSGINGTSSSSGSNNSSGSSSGKRDITRSTDGSTVTSGTGSNSNDNTGKYGTHDRPKILLSGVTPHNTDEEKEEERKMEIEIEEDSGREKGTSVQIIAIAKVSQAASEQEREHSQAEAKARLACRLRARSHRTTTPSLGDSERGTETETVTGRERGTGTGTERDTTESVRLEGVMADQGEDGTSGVKDPLHPDIREDSANGTRTHNSSSTDGRTGSLCISQLLFDLNSADLRKDVSKRLFVTHAQYKFAYRIACDFCRKK